MVRLGGGGGGGGEAPVTASGPVGEEWSPMVRTARRRREVGAARGGRSNEVARDGEAFPCAATGAGRKRGWGEAVPGKMKKAAGEASLPSETLHGGNWATMDGGGGCMSVTWRAAV